jgi:hypothetical protein
MLKKRKRNYGVTIVKKADVENLAAELREQIRDDSPETKVNSVILHDEF